MEMLYSPWKQTPNLTEIFEGLQTWPQRMPMKQPYHSLQNSPQAKRTLLCPTETLYPPRTWQPHSMLHGTLVGQGKGSSFSPKQAQYLVLLLGELNSPTAWFLQHVKTEQ